MRKIFLLILVCVCCCMEHAHAAQGFKHLVVKGRVTDDFGKGIPDVKITDGRTITRTDNKGRYVLQTLSDREYVYYTLPSGYQSVVDNCIPHFYEKIDKGKSLQKIDFVLQKSEMVQKEHSFIVWGDPQVYREEEFVLLKEVVDDMKATMAASGKSFHAISVGDNVFDRHNLIGKYIETISALDIPFYHVIGNHDMDYNKRSNKFSDKTYGSYFGPSHYSFDVGDIHYIVLNNVFYYGFTYRYIGYVTEEQLSWLEQDLSFVPENKTVVVSLHIPTMFDKARKPRDFANLLSSSVMNNMALYKILQGHNVHIMAGHSHVQWNTQIAGNILEHTHAAASGAWWQGDFCTDGSPKGYTVYEVNGDSVSWYFKGLNQDKDEQFRIYIKEDTLHVNVFNYDDKWKLEYFEDGQPVGELNQYVGVDPIAKQAYMPGKNKVHRWLTYKKTAHLFKVKIRNESAELKVVATDRFGRKFVKTISPYKLVWCDEFDKDGFPDEKNWSYATKGNATGWGNNEAQFYTASDEKNAYVSDGTLKIIARKEEKEGKKYTSARLTTKGKGDWLYGKIEVRAKLPYGRGAWSAIWMLPSDNAYGEWPKSGEIDIMENVGYAGDSIVSTAHTQQYNHIMNTQESGVAVDETCHSQFHSYTLEWDEYEWKTYIDGKLIYIWKNDFSGFKSWPFDQKFHLILNLAIGGSWGGKEGIDNSLFPKKFEIDYVRVYQRL